MRRTRLFLRSDALAALALIGSLVVAAPASAQYLPNNFHGDFGVNSGTQPGPGFYLGIPFAQWNVDHIKDADADTFLTPFQDFDVRAFFPTIIAVTPGKVLGAKAQDLGR